MSPSYARRAGSKYGVRTDPKGVQDRTCDNIVFHSKGECLRYQELKMYQRIGIISGLNLQPKFPLHVNRIHIGDYVADFEYQDKEGRRVIEDFKGKDTPEYRLKFRIFHAVYPMLRITEVRAK